MFDYILITIAFIWLIFAAIYDFKTREVPDWLSYSFIAIALSIKLIYSLITKDFNIFISSLIGLGAFGLLGTLLYYLKQWGGGDAKLLMGIGAMFADYPASLTKVFIPNLNIPFLMILFINIMFLGAIYGIFYIVGLALINKDKLKKIEVKVGRNKFYLVLFIILIALVILLNENESRLLVIIMAILVLVLPKLIIFISIVEKNLMYKTIPTTKLTEGDWIKDDIKVKGKLIYNNKSLGVNKHQIEQLKKYNIKRVTVKYGIPFVVSFLLGLITSLIFGNILIPI